MFSLHELQYVSFHWFNQLIQVLAADGDKNYGMTTCNLFIACITVVRILGAKLPLPVALSVRLLWHLAFGDFFLKPFKYILTLNS